MGLWESLSAIGSNYPGAFIICSMIVIILGVLVVNGLFQASDTMRNNILFNNFTMTIVSVLGVYWFITTFMGQKITILGREFDIGLVMYISLALFVLFVLGG